MNNKPVLIALAVVAVLSIGIVGCSDSTPEPESQVVPIPIKAPAPPPAPEPEPVEAVVIPVPVVEAEVPVEPPKPAFVLPRLDDSDQLIRDGTASLSSDPTIREWLLASDLARRFATASDAVSRGNVPRLELEPLTPTVAFSAIKISESQYHFDERGFARYDGVAATISSLDARRAAEFYSLVRPLLQQAYGELGYPDGNVDQVVLAAIGRLLETPLMTEPVVLVRPVVMYEFEDERLEKLSPVQKQMIRMGPVNARIIQEKLSEIALELRSILENR